jgi:hypothetical protein
MHFGVQSALDLAMGALADWLFILLTHLNHDFIHYYFRCLKDFQLFLLGVPISSCGQ